MIIGISILFLLIAMLYSSVGFGGGSSYIALLILFGLPFEHIPILALICNLIVVSFGSLYFIYQKHIEVKKIIPFIMSSIPMAYFGGRITIDPFYFKLILGICLFLSSLKMFLNKDKNYQTVRSISYVGSIIIGGVLGFISGLVGIGGGIFLSPILFNFRWAYPKEIAGICSVFIFFNSFSGLIGQVQKHENLDFLSSYTPLFICVFLGGQLGSYLGSKKIKPRSVEVLTSILVFIVSLRILYYLV